MEKGKAPANGYYRGSSSNANPIATTNEHDVVTNRADAHCNANPMATANEHVVVVERANAVCIDLTNDAEEPIEVEIHRHFSIRGYVAERRRNNPHYSVLQLPPLELPSFRWWRCDDCVSSITDAVDASVNASEDHGAHALNKHNDNITTECPLVEASEGHGAHANNVDKREIETRCPSGEDSEPNPENRDSDEMRAPSSDGNNAVPSNATSEEGGSTDLRAGIERLTLGGCRNPQARKKSRKMRTMIDLLSSCEPQLCNVNEASPLVPRVLANDSPSHEADRPPAVLRRKTPNVRELGGGRRVKVPATKRKTPDTELEPEWTRMRHRITRTVTEMSGDGSLKRAAEMSARTLSLPLCRDDVGCPLPAPERPHGESTSSEQRIVPFESARGSHGGTSDLGRNPVIQNPVEINGLHSPVVRSSRAEIRDFDLNVPAQPEDDTEKEEWPRSSNAELLPSASIPAQGTHDLPNTGLTPGAAPVLLIQRPSEPQPAGRLSAFRPYQCPVLASPLVAGSSNQHSNAECPSSHAGARARSSRGETEVCQINRNPADFSVVGPRNPFMVGREDPDKRKKFSRAEKGKRKIDEAD